MLAQLGPMAQFFGTRMPALRERFGDRICDFAAGNPQEGALEPYLAALKRNAEPRAPDWYAYKVSEPDAQAVVAASLRDYLGIPFQAEDIALTNASIAALAVTLHSVPGFANAMARAMAV